LEYISLHFFFPDKCLQVVLSAESYKGQMRE